MTRCTVFEVYDSTGKNVGYFLRYEEKLAKEYAADIGGYYKKSTKVFG